MSRFSVTFPSFLSNPTQMPLGQGLGLSHGMAPFSDGMPDLFIRTVPPERDCFVESGDEVGGGGETVKAGPKRKGTPGARSASTGERVGKAGRQDRSVGGSGPETEKYFPYRSMDQFFEIVGSRAESFPQQVSDRTIKCLPWILDQKPDREAVERVLRLILPKNHAIRDQFAKDWLDLGLIEGQVRRYFENFVRALPRVPDNTDPAAHGLQFPQELWKGYGAWWTDLQRQADVFVRVHMKLKGNKAKAEINKLLEMEKANYEKLLPLKAKTHEAIRDSLVLIPGGMFMMGADDLDEDSRPVHAVWISSFLMMDVPVTNAMWFAVMETRPSVQYDINGKIFSRDDQPVVGVTWNMADAFAQKVGCVLPSEAQWERAAKGGRDYAYGTRDGTLSPDLVVSGCFTGYQFTASVKNWPANPFGLYDMCGNVWQWCKDGWKRVYTEEPVINPIGVAARLSIIRGGSWRFRGQYLRSASRTCHPDYSHAFGFRVVVPQDS